MPDLSGTDLSVVDIIKKKELSDVLATHEVSDLTAPMKEGHVYSHGEGKANH